MLYIISDNTYIVVLLRYYNDLKKYYNKQSTSQNDGLYSSKIEGVPGFSSWISLPFKIGFAMSRR
jgi:hypothetical protein